MDYRIVETEQTAVDALTGTREVARFDSAYAAVDVMRRAMLDDRERGSRWYLLDPEGRLLCGPDDVIDSIGPP